MAWSGHCWDERQDLLKIIETASKFLLTQGTQIPVLFQFRQKKMQVFLPERFLLSYVRFAVNMTVDYHPVNISK